MNKHKWRGLNGPEVMRNCVLFTWECSIHWLKSLNRNIKGTPQDAWCCLKIHRPSPSSLCTLGIPIVFLNFVMNELKFSLLRMPSLFTLLMKQSSPDFAIRLTDKFNQSHRKPVYGLMAPLSNIRYRIELGNRNRHATAALKLFQQ